MPRPEQYFTSTIGIVAPEGIGAPRVLSLVRWQDKTVQNAADMNPDFIYFFVDWED